LKSSIDTVITAETPEGIAIAMRPAGFAVRATAFMIDVLIRFAILSALGSVLNAGGHVGTGLLLIGLFVVNWLYPVIFELLPAAATPGKRVMGLQVMMANGLPLTPAGCLTRNLLRVVDMMPLLYAFAIIAMLLRRDARRLGDLAGGTLVVYCNMTDTPATIGEGDPAPPAMPLSSRQSAAIAAFAWRVQRLTAERAEEIAVLGAAAAPRSNGETSVTARLIGVARWQHGQRRRATAAAETT
jgi:uncharacterized RDD family membrane protein YckC